MGITASLTGHRARGAALAALLCASCGGEESSTASKPTAETARPTPTATSPPQATPARTDDECLDLWNDLERLGSAGQKSSADYLADLAETGLVRVAVRYGKPDCVLLARDPEDRRRALLFVAKGGKGPWSSPARLDLRRQVPRGRAVQYNAAASEDGQLEPGR